MLFNKFINDLEEEKAPLVCSRFQTGSEINVLCGRAGIQGDADRLEEWADMSPLKFRRDLCKDLHFRWSTVYWAVL